MAAAPELAGSLATVARGWAELRQRLLQPPANGSAPLWLVLFDPAAAVAASWSALAADAGRPAAVGLAALFEGVPVATVASLSDDCDPTMEALTG